jgi:hypothetical protein
MFANMGKKIVAAKRYAIGTRSDMWKLHEQGGLKGRHLKLGVLGAIAVAGPILGVSTYKATRYGLRAEHAKELVKKIRFDRNFYRGSGRQIPKSIGRKLVRTIQLEDMAHGFQKLSTLWTLGGGFATGAAIGLSKRTAGMAQMRARKRRK